MSELHGESVDIAVGRGLAFLGRRDRTRAEVVRHLRAKGFSESDSEGAADELSRMGYLDDLRFCIAYAEGKRRTEAWADERIRMRLRELGAPRAVIDQALAHGSPDTEVQRALRLLERRLSEPAVEEGDRRRAMGILVRRGYSPETAADAIREHRRGNP